jgi:hypothetical protein
MLLISKYLGLILNHLYNYLQYIIYQVKYLIIVIFEKYNLNNLLILHLFPLLYHKRFQLYHRQISKVL